MKRLKISEIDESGSIDENKVGLNYLQNIHGIPVIESPYIKEPTLLVPIGYGKIIESETKKTLEI